MAFPKMLATVTAALVALLMFAATAKAQTPSCASHLIPCAQYLNSTKPPASCCDPLKQAVTKDLSCLCNLYKNPEVLKSFRVNVTQALGLPKYCGISNDVSACNKSAIPTSSPASVPPPATPSGMGRIAWTRVSCLLLLGASLLLW